MQQPIARHSDPETSHLAAHYLEASGKQRRLVDIVVTLVTTYPGRTYTELFANHLWECDQVPRLDPVFKSSEALMKRLSDANRATPPRVVKRGRRECRHTGSQALTWYPADD